MNELELKGRITAGLKNASHTTHYPLTQEQAEALAEQILNELPRKSLAAARRLMDTRKWQRTPWNF